MTISEEDKKAHDEYINNLTADQMQQMTERTTVMLQEWATKEELGSEDHKYIADLAVPVGMYVLLKDSIEEVDPTHLSVLIMSTAVAAYHYGRAQLREELGQE